ncbi:acyltransferase family protein [Vibrio sp. OCN044]|uniref:Acyltransferase family protein n=1 Tax=Vibrio tetraodonis subsp. pristinus TaxID=2695891 RepID=A0A6L8LWT0_9VIBR|nr:acyltransferase family protein [Vibrio tetraodonis]MYM59626.1 acyltransferase family protein [Vibrio tetraodonis subsp. pristinus]
MNFRYDINALRAIAVLGVIFFHAGVSVFEGGFLGVDVFFVISGFLITSHLIKDFNSDDFSIIKFYDRRVRRIMPALIVTMLVTTVASFFFMLPYDLKNFGQSLVSSAFGANNILLYLTSGYWSLAAEFKPLYHTWSLGVEEQYYFIIPIILMLFFSKGMYGYALSFLFLTSWIFSFNSQDLEFDFLSITNRFWELCSGSLLAIFYPKIKYSSDKLSALGFLLIIASYVSPYAISKSQAIYSILPVVGTMLIILFSKKNGVVSKFCKNKPINILGFSSYSIYLLHQPLLAFFRLSHEGETTVGSELVVSLMAVPLGFLMWKYIENLFRDRERVKNKAFYSLVSISIVCIVSFGLLLHKTYGLQNIHIHQKYSYGNNPQAYADKPYKLAKDHFESTGNKMLIVGNSFARDFTNAITEVDLVKGYEVVYLYDYYQNLELSRKLSSDADVVFWVSSAGMANTVIDSEKLKSKTKEIKKELDTYAKNYLFIGTKNYGFNNNFVKQLHWDDSVDYMVDINHSNILANQDQSEIFAEKYVDLLELTRDGNKTRLFTNEHRFLSFDTDHITKHGAIYIGNLLLKDDRLSRFKL